MTETIEHYVSMISPWSYMGAARLLDIAHANHAAVDHKPIRLATVFPATGGLPLAQRSAERRAYRMAELARWRDHLDIPLTLEPAFFPADDTHAARLVIAAKTAGADVGPLVVAILRAIWAEERDVADTDTLAAIADEFGLDGGALVAAGAGDDIGAVFDAYTEDAMAAGVFGAPSYVIAGEVFWGQDRLDFVERKLAGRR